MIVLYDETSLFSKIEEVEREHARGEFLFWEAEKHASWSRFVHMVWHSPQQSFVVVFGP